MPGIRRDWWAMGIAGCALTLLVLAFLPWFDLVAAKDGTEIGTVLRTHQTGWTNASSVIVVLAGVIAAVLALVPRTAGHGLYVGPAVVAAALALVRVAIPPDATVLGTSLSYSRTPWTYLVLAAAVIQCGFAIASVSHRNHAPVR